MPELLSLIESPQRIKLNIQRHFNLLSITLLLKSLVNRIRIANIVAKQRKMLASLDSNQLKDMGISQDQAKLESARGFWDLPEHLK